MQSQRQRQRKKRKRREELRLVDDPKGRNLIYCRKCRDWLYQQEASSLISSSYYISWKKTHFQESDLPWKRKEGGSLCCCGRGKQWPPLITTSGQRKFLRIEKVGIVV